MEHFVIKSLSIFFPLYLYSLDHKFVFLVKWKRTRGPGGGVEAHQIFAEEKKIGEKDKKGKFSNKKPSKADTEVEHFLL